MSAELPAWDSPELDTMASEFVDWLRAAAKLKGFEPAVIERRFDYPGEMRKLIETLVRNDRLHQVEVPEIVFNAQEWASALTDPRKQKRWQSSIARSYFRKVYAEKAAERRT